MLLKRHLIGLSGRVGDHGEAPLFVDFEIVRRNSHEVLEATLDDFMTRRRRLP